MHLGFSIDGLKTKSDVGWAIDNLVQSLQRYTGWLPEAEEKLRPLVAECEKFRLDSKGKGGKYNSKEAVANMRRLYVAVANKVR